MSLYELFINPHDQDGTTPLHSAANGGHTKTVKLLLDMGANIEARSLVSSRIYHMSYLIVFDFFEHLLMLFALFFITYDQTGKSPLYSAAHGGYHDTVKFLLDKGAEINAAKDVRERHDIPYDLFVLFCFNLIMPFA
jgi:ankyrin repeat protein